MQKNPQKTKINNHWTRQFNYPRFTFEAALIVVALILTACSHTVPMLGADSFSTKPAATILPLTVGTYYSTDLRNHEEKVWKKGDRWDFPLGPATVTMFDKSAPLVFTKTIPVRTLPPYSDNSGIDAVIEPRLETFDFHLPWIKTGTYEAEISYRIILYDKSGATVASWVVNGVGAQPGKLGFEFSRWPGEAADLAVADAMRKFVDGYADVPDVRAWLKKHKEKLSALAPPPGTASERK